MSDGKAMRYCWEFHPNAEIATLHVDFRVPRGDWGGLRFRTTDEVRPGDDAAARLGEIAGVESVCFAGLAAYQIRIEKAFLFAWADLCPAVVESVRNHFGYESAEEAEPRPEPIHDRHRRARDTD